MSEAETIESTIRRYYLDAEFHAKAHAAAGLVAGDVHRRTGVRLTPKDLGVARMAAAVALTLAERRLGGPWEPVEGEEGT